MNTLVKKKEARTVDPNELRTLVRCVKQSLRQMQPYDKESLLREVRSLLRLVEGKTLTEIHSNLEQQEIKQEYLLNHPISNLLFYELCAETLLAL